ncbi:MAG: hypothetical protein P1U89_20765 [Verrucomicrobiales bacterium]|nr:hypothetical protein [Verrucomicrobiales bacterium]
MNTTEGEYRLQLERTFRRFDETIRQQILDFTKETLPSDTICVDFSLYLSGHDFDSFPLNPIPMSRDGGYNEWGSFFSSAPFDFPSNLSPFSEEWEEVGDTCNIFLDEIAKWFGSLWESSVTDYPHPVFVNEVGGDLTAYSISAHRWFMDEQRFSSG